MRTLQAPFMFPNEGFPYQKSSIRHDSNSMNYIEKKHSVTNFGNCYVRLQAFKDPLGFPVCSATSIAIITSQERATENFGMPEKSWIHTPHVYNSSLPQCQNWVMLHVLMNCLLDLQVLQVLLGSRLRGLLLDAAHTEILVPICLLQSQVPSMINTKTLINFVKTCEKLVFAHS